MRVGHYQCQPAHGDFDACLAKFAAALELAARDRVDILSFPECFFSGYYTREADARRHAFPLDSPQTEAILAATRRHDAAVIVGLNETDGPDLYNTALVAERGRLLGRYRKATAYMPFHRQGREFPVFRRGDLVYGVVICSDGGYIEPCRILALKGARIVFAPHANHIAPAHLLDHFLRVRADHAARCAENGIWFVRGNDVCLVTPNPATDQPGVTYGDSYVMDPNGEIMARSRRMEENLVFADIDPDRPADTTWEVGRSAFSLREMGDIALAALREREAGAGTAGSGKP